MQVGDIAAGTMVASPVAPFPVHPCRRRPPPRGSMSGNITFRHHDSAVLSVTAVDAPVVVTSAEFDARLAETYRRTRVPAGMLSRLAGIRERRWWPEGTSFVDGAIEAGAKAMAEAGV